MFRRAMLFCVTIGFLAATGCTTSYKAKPLPFKTPASFENMATVAGAQVAARAFADPAVAKEAFGFDIRKAGMLPVQVVFDNLGTHPLEINGQQSFLEDETGNLWPILSREMAYERATRYAQTEQTFIVKFPLARIGNSDGKV